MDRLFGPPRAKEPFHGPQRDHGTNRYAILIVHLGAFKDRIETEISGQLDELLGTPNPTSVA